MSRRIAKRQDFLRLLAKTRPKDRKRRNALIALADKSELAAISELVLNALKGNIPLKPKLKRVLQKEKVSLRRISDKKYPVKKKKRILKQSGGFLGALIPVALKAAASILGPLLFPK